MKRPEYLDARKAVTDPHQQTLGGPKVEVEFKDSDHETIKVGYGGDRRGTHCILTINPTVYHKALRAWQEEWRNNFPHSVFCDKCGDFNAPTPAKASNCDCEDK